MTDKPLQDAMLNEAQEIRVKKLSDELIWFEDIKPIFKANYVVDGVIYRDSNVLVIAESGAGKTFLALDLALSVATGRPWHGKKVKQGNVLYLAAEAGASVTRRVEAYRVHHQVSRAQLAIRTLPLNLLDPATPRHLLDLFDEVTAAHGPIQMIVIDTVSRSMPGAEENSAETMTEYIRICDQLRAATGAAIVLVHHKGKDNTRGARGHSSLKAAVDTEIDISVSANGKVAKVTKQRDEESGAEFRFALRQVEIGTNDEGAAVTSCVVVDADTPEAEPDPEAHLNERQRTALAALREFVPAYGSDKYRGAIPGKPAIAIERVLEHLIPLMKGIAHRSHQREAAKRTLEMLGRQNLVIIGKTKVSLP